MQQVIRGLRSAAADSRVSTLTPDEGGVVQIKSALYGYMWFAFTVQPTYG